MMKKTIITLITLVLTLLSATATSAYFQYTGPRAHNVDPGVRIGGPFYDMAEYHTGLRSGITTHPPLNYNLRYGISSANYPRENIYGPHGQRRHARVGGYYSGRIGAFRGIPSGDFVYNGRVGSRLGGGTITGRY